MKTKLLSILCCLPILTWARGNTTYKQVETLYSNAEWLCINRVEMNDTATIVDITASGKINGDFQLSKNIHLCGENGKTYNIKKVENVVLEDKNYIGRDGTHSFSLYFEPLAKDTKAFDLLEGWSDNDIRILGIYNKKKGLKFLKVKDDINGKEITEDKFTQGNVRIEGKIEDFTTENKDEKLVFHNNKYEGLISNQLHYKYNKPRFEIKPDGTFCIDININHPLWTKIDFVKRKKEIPIYVRPGDTLNINIKNWQKEVFDVQYTCSNPLGCYENLMKHSNVPIIYAQWNKLTNFGQNLDDEHFVSGIRECTEKNMQLCDYFAWKYKLTPWETHLLKNRQLLLLTEQHLFIASKSVQEKFTIPQGREPQKEDYTGYNFSIYKIMDLLPHNDPSLCYILNNTSFPRSIDLIYPIGLAKTYAFFNNPNNKVDQYKEETKIQIETLQDLMGTEESSNWIIESYLVYKITQLPNSLNTNERNEIVDFISSSLTIPYYKNKLQELIHLVNEKNK